MAALPSSPLHRRRVATLLGMGVYINAAESGCAVAYDDLRQRYSLLQCEALPGYAYALDVELYSSNFPQDDMVYRHLQKHFSAQHPLASWTQLEVAAKLTGQPVHLLLQGLDENSFVRFCAEYGMVMDTQIITGRVMTIGWRIIQAEAQCHGGLLV